MKKAGSDKKDPAPEAPPRTKGSALGDHSDPESPHHDHKLHLPKMGDKWKKILMLTTYTILAVLGILVSLATIIMTSIASVATKAFDAEQSSRLMAMIVLAVTAAITLSMIIYTVVGAYRKKTKALHASGIVLVIIAVLQALIIAVAIHVTASDEMSINKTLSESFYQARMDKPKHVKIWTATQYDLNCCGLNSPEDYRDPNMPYFFPPNVPVSCCPSFDYSRPAHEQEKQREMCKANGTYYDHGCRGSVIEVVKKTSSLIVGIVVVLIILELIIAAVGYVILRKYKRDEKKKHAEQTQGPAPNSAQKS